MTHRIVCLSAAVCIFSFGWPAEAFGQSSRCRSDLPRHATALSEALDSVALQRELTDLWAPETGLVLTRMGYDSTGVQTPVTVYSETLSTAQDSSLRVVLAEAAPKSGDPRDVLLFFIGDEAGPNVRRVRRFEACPPELLDRNELTGRLQQVSRGLQLSGRTTVLLSAYVLTDGSVGEIRVQESSRDFDIDFTAVEVVRTASFEPARQEGFPIAVWIAFPVTFEPPRPRR